MENSSWKFQGIEKELSKETPGYYLQQGRIEEQKGNFKTAIKNYAEASKRGLKIGNLLVAQISLSQKQYFLAEKYSYKALPFFKNTAMENILINNIKEIGGKLKLNSSFS